MDRITLYKLNLHTPLHIGAHGVGYEETEDMIHSDTLFSAVMSLWTNFYDDNIEAFCQSPPFSISSAFPFKGDALFFPRPMVKIGKDEARDEAKAKKLKNVKYVSQELLEEILKGNSGAIEFNEEETSRDGTFWDNGSSTDRHDAGIIFSKNELPRVTVDRHTNASEIFYFSEVVFERDAGLFFLARFFNKEIKPQFESILRLLGDEGMGGDKRAGKGLYSLKVEEGFEIALPETVDSFLTLSLYCPTEEEFANGILREASYDLTTRKGWLHVPGAMSLRRKAVRMFREGSVFGSLERRSYGSCPCVLERLVERGLSHNVYRYGLAFNMPMRKNRED